MNPPPSDAAEALPALPAATVMLARDDPGGVEVFVMRRTARAAFAPDVYVFPGGKVDPGDAAPELAPFCAGLSDEQASARLGLDGGGLAYWVASIRECFEEAGVLLARHRDGGPPVFDEGDRRAVHSRALSMAELCRRHELVLDLSAIHYIAHWVTPVGESRRRFDTRFFLAAAPADQEGIHDDVETVHSQWVRPGRALSDGAAGRLALMQPTRACLGFLDEHDTVAAALAAADAADAPPRIQPRLRRADDGRIAGVSLPGDPDYDDLP